MDKSTIFITYNPENESEQTLATRVHTIGAVNGFRMYLPDRFNSDSVLDYETKKRIDNSNWVVMFSLSNHLSSIVKQEIEYAYQHLKDKSKIIVIYSTTTGINLKGKSVNHFTEIFFDPFNETVDHVINKIFKEIFKRQKKENQIKQLKARNNEKNALLALLGIGLGLVVIGALASE